MGERYLDSPTIATQDKITKAIKLFAVGCSSRSVELKLRTDRQSIKRWMDFDIAFTSEYARMVRSAVIRRNFTYKQFLDRFGKKGLTALFRWFKDKTYDDNKDMAARVMNLRRKGITYREIQDLTGRSVSSLQRSVTLAFGPAGLTGNVVFNRVRERDKQLLADYKDGMTPNQLAVKYRKSVITIRGILHDKFGVAIQRAGIGARHYDRIKLLLAKGMNWKDIAYVIQEGSSPQCIRKAYEEENFRRTVNEDYQPAGYTDDNAVVEPWKRHKGNLGNITDSNKTRP